MSNLQQLEDRLKAVEGETKEQMQERLQKNAEALEAKKAQDDQPDRKK